MECQNIFLQIAAAIYVCEKEITPRKLFGTFFYYSEKTNTVLYIAILFQECTCIIYHSPLRHRDRC